MIVPENENIDENYILGLHAWNMHNFEEAKCCFLLSAENGYAESMYMLASYYENIENNLKASERYTIMYMNHATYYNSFVNRYLISRNEYTYEEFLKYEKKFINNIFDDYKKYIIMQLIELEEENKRLKYKFFIPPTHDDIYIIERMNKILSIKKYFKNNKYRYDEEFSGYVEDAYDIFINEKMIESDNDIINIFMGIYLQL